MFKKILSVFLALTIAFGCLSMAVIARQVGVGGGAESFNPVEFYQDIACIGDTRVNVNLVAKITDENYKVKINSINVVLPFVEAGDTSSITVSYDSGEIVDDETNLRNRT